MEMTWSHKEWMWVMSESDISVPIEISAAAFRTASRSSGRIEAKSVVAAFVRKPTNGMNQCLVHPVWDEVRVPMCRITFA